MDRCREQSAVTLSEDFDPAHGGIGFFTGENSGIPSGGNRERLMSEQLSELYPVALEMGILAETFWNLSVNEIFDTLANIRRRLLREEKQRIMDNFIQAQAIAVDISALFAKDGKIAHPWDYYPELFEKEQKAYEEAEEARQWEEYMEKRRAYNAEWNYRHNH